MQKILRNRLAKKTFIGARLKKIKRQKTLFHKQIKYGRLFGTTKNFPLFGSIQLSSSTHLPEMRKKREKNPQTNLAMWMTMTMMGYER